MFLSSSHNITFFQLSSLQNDITFYWCVHTVILALELKHYVNKVGLAQDFKLERR